MATSYQESGQTAEGHKELQGVAGVSSVKIETMVTLAKTQTVNGRLVNFILCKLYFNKVV